MWINLHSRLPLAALSAVLLLGISALAGAFMWALHRVHGQMAHETAALSVIEKGRTIAEQLAREQTVKSGLKSEKEWRDFAGVVRRLSAIEQSLQYVSVTENGVTLFHEQTRTDDLTNASDSASPAVLIGRKLLQVGGEKIPLLVFTSLVRTEEGAERIVEVALRRDAVGQAESAATVVLGSMFKLSFLTVLVAFGICTALIMWVMRREAQRERKRREQESLAFAGVLANGIAHDFRNPMSSLKLDAQMLCREIQKGAAMRRERVSELAEHMRSTTDRMEKVFQEFLLLSRPSSESTEEVDIVGSVREILDLLSPRLQHADITVEVKAPQEPICVTMPAGAFRRALLNVISNAEQFSGAGGKITIGISKTNGAAIVEVIDSGPGIPDEIRGRMFDMFVSTRPGGTGLGLFLAKTAMDRCGGTIEASNMPTGGACFRLSVPISPERGG